MAFLEAPLGFAILGELGIILHEGLIAVDGGLVAFGLIIELGHIKFMLRQILAAAGQIKIRLGDVFAVGVFLLEPLEFVYGLQGIRLVPVDGGALAIETLAFPEDAIRHGLVGGMEFFEFPEPWKASSYFFLKK